jgi:hypothetical protein
MILEYSGLRFRLSIPANLSGNTQMQLSRRHTLRLMSGTFALGSSLPNIFSGSAKAADSIEWLATDSLAGWAPTDFFKPGQVSVKNGVLSLAKGKPMTGVTTTRKDLPKTNFEVQYEARRLDGDDFFAAFTFPVLDGFLTFVNGGWSGNITGLSSIDGSDASENETGKPYKFENEIWYRFRVSVKEQLVICSVNDKPVIEFDGIGRSLKTRVESRASEPFGFACYDCTSEIRKVKLIRL